MSAGMIVFITLSVAILFIFIILTVVTTEKNLKADVTNLLLPFAATLDRVSPSSISLTRKNDSGDTIPQIQCPAGYNVNIVSAWHEVYNPYGSCDNKSFDILAASCGSSSGVSTCNIDNDCGDATMICDEGTCVQKTCSTDSDCGSDHFCNANSGRCARSPLCNNLSASFVNNYCSPAGLNYKNCKTRDVSAYLAKECNGQNSCNVSLTPDTLGAFGPSPCDLLTSDADYSNLPTIPGYPGGIPSNGTSSTPANVSGGYYVHGLFSCVAE